MCKHLPAEKVLRKTKKSLDIAAASWYYTKVKQSRNGPRPHPRHSAKGLTVKIPPELSVCFIVLRAAVQADRICFCLEVLPIANTAHQINEEIRDKEIRLISDSGEQLGIMSAQDALRMAEEQNLDLVKISPNAVPPVCKLMDYGKFRFEQTKREKEVRKNQRVVEIKEVRMSPSIDVNDFNVKMRNAQKFLSEGNRCKVTVRFRGREMAHTEIGQDLLAKFAEGCSEIAVMDKAPKLEGRHMSIFLSPKPAKDTKK